uniref:Uncharacterized protein n=1 Tax=Anguilla anguilla TaxID=7936 RepID=A0A0E9THK2_ANGAN
MNQPCSCVSLPESCFSMNGIDYITVGGAIIECIIHFQLPL